MAAEELSAAHGMPAVVVDLDAGRAPAPGAGPDGLPALVAAARAVPAVLIGVAHSDANPAAGLCDLVLADREAVEGVVGAVEQHPLASVALALLLRESERRTVADGLAAESAAYSMLQGGPEFAAWRASHPASPRAPDDGPRVVLQREHGRLTVTLSRPAMHNAVDARMRDELYEAFTMAASDPSLVDVVLQGGGPSFCSGGDLDEFGSRPDPASAHVVRLTRSAGRAIAMIADRVTARLHGHCLGAGIELPAFAGRVVARPGTEIALPEVGLGLVPGAGGTVSLPRRIGRHRTAYLALSGVRLDATTAHAWGLVDEVASE